MFIMFYASQGMLVLRGMHRCMEQFEVCEKATEEMRVLLLQRAKKAEAQRKEHLWQAKEAELHS